MLGSTVPHQVPCRHRTYATKQRSPSAHSAQIDTLEAVNEYSELNYWAKFFVASTWEEIQMLSEKSEGIQIATTTLKKLTNDEKIKLQCEAREKYDHDIASIRDCG